MADGYITVVERNNKVTIVERPNNVSIVSNLVPVDRSSSDHYVNLIADKVLANVDNKSIFTNTDAPAMVNIDFSAVGSNRSFVIMVTDEIGFNLLPTGTFFMSGQEITGPISSTTPGSVIKATIINDTQIFLQADGSWSYE